MLLFGSTSQYTNNNTMLEVYTDGATEGKNGKLGTVTHVGLGVWIPELNYMYSARREGISNNEAEYMALIEAMQYCLENDYLEAHFFLDSELVVNGSKQYKKTKNARMMAFKNKIYGLKKNFNAVEFSWIPREENKEADALSKQGLQEKVTTREKITALVDIKSIKTSVLLEELQRRISQCNTCNT